MEIILDHIIPTVGKVRFPLHGFAGDLYQVFDQVGEIHRLKTLNQLGAIRLINPGAHHTRWDYITFYLFILRLLKTHDKTLGLSSNNIQLSEGKSISKLELLQAYMLLRNYGHLTGTFHVEQILLEQFKAHPTSRDFFLKGLVSEKMQNYGIDIINKEHVWQFHKLISVYLIQQNKDTRFNKLRAAALQVFELFLFDQNHSVVQLKRLHDAVRKIAYVTLDLRYSGGVVDISSSSVVTEPERIVSFCRLIGIF